MEPKIQEVGHGVPQTVLFYVLFHRPELKANKGKCSSHWDLNLRFSHGFVLRTS